MQRRLAKAAEDQAQYTKFNVALLFATFAAALWAAWEAKRAAEAGQEGVRATDEASQRQSRAYVTLWSATVRREGNSFFLATEFKNGGQTPAINTSGHLCGGSGSFDRTDFAEPDAAKSSMVLGPGGNYVLTKRLDPPEKVIDAIDNGTATIFAWGTVRYDDLFLGKAVLGFRVYARQSIGKDESRMSICPEGNCFKIV